MNRLNHSDHPGAWTSKELPDKQLAIHELSAKTVENLVTAAEQFHARGVPFAQLGRSDFDSPMLATDTAQISHELLHGRGFVVLAGLPIEGHEQATHEHMYWGLGLQLGTPVSQSVMGDVMGYVADVTGQEKNVRPYRSRGLLRLHTDFTDMSGLFCIRTAKSGGESSVVSTLSIHDEMMRRRPDLLETLYRGFHFHRLGEQAENESPITGHRVPIFSETEGYVSCRYSRAYIIEAERATGNELSNIEQDALDLFDEIAYREDMCVSFNLEPGEVLFMNSHTTLHTRTAFEDWKTPTRKRLLLRLWLAAYEPRPLVPDIAIYSGNTNGVPKRGRGEPAGFQRLAGDGYDS